MSLRGPELQDFGRDSDLNIILFSIIIKMKIIALTLLVWLISAQYASDELPTLDVRNSANQVMDESYKMKIEKSDSYFKIILDYNPSTGYQWYRLSNQAHNCLSKIKLVDQKVIEDYEGPRRMGASQTLE